MADERNNAEVVRILKCFRRVVEEPCFHAEIRRNRRSCKDILHPLQRRLNALMDFSALGNLEGSYPLWHDVVVAFDYVRSEMRLEAR